MKVKYLGLLVLCLTIFGKPAFSQYLTSHGDVFFNPSRINPVFLEDTSLLHANAIAKEQWLGFEGAPEEYTLHAQTAFEKVGFSLGFNASYEKIGFHKNWFMMVQTKKVLWRNENSKIDMGLQAGIVRRKMVSDWFSPTGELISFESYPFYLPVLDLGFSYTFKNQSIGLAYKYTGSSLEEEPTLTNEDAWAAHYAADYAISKDFTLTPQIFGLFRYDISSAFFGAKLTYKDFLTAGLYSDETFNNIAILLSGVINKRIKIGYYYKLSFNKLNQHHNGTHALNLGIMLK